MTFEDLLSQIGTGTKHLTDRYSNYPGPIHEHDHHVFYAYEPSAPPSGHIATSKQNYGGGHHKNSASMSALTLLAFLFFLHILQQCIKDQMADMNETQPLVVMTAGREGEETVSKSVIDKIDKTGVTRTDVNDNSENKAKLNKQNKITEIKNSYDYGDLVNKQDLMKVHTTNYETKSNEQKFKYPFNSANRSSFTSGFFSAMDDE